MKKELFIFFVLIGLLACKSPQEQYLFFAEDYNDFHYNMEQPNEYYGLAPRLREISGLTYRSATSLLCINDEEGVVFDYDVSSGEIAALYSFGKAGDYEGVELVNGILYVLRSNGDIYEVKNFNTDSITTIRHRTQLSSVNNAEGLCYDKRSNALLIACKGKPLHKRKGEKAVYAFSLDTYQLKEEPIYRINQYQIEQIITDLSNRKGFEKEGRFCPSAIAIHPITQNIYVLASVGKKLLVLNSYGAILAIVKLNPSVFFQPEGICFSPDGTMFICNEEKVGRANILQFNYETKF